MPNAGVNYVLPDGATVLPLRYLTWHADDAAALEAHYTAEHLGNAVVKQLAAVESAKDSKSRSVNNKIAVQTRIERNAACRDLVKALMAGKPADEIEKVVSQCGETEYDEIMEICRQSPDYGPRQVRTLCDNQPVALANTLTAVISKLDNGQAQLLTLAVDLLKLTEAGRQTLRDMCANLKPLLESNTPPSGTT